MPEQQINIVKQLEALFNDIYRNEKAGQKNVRCLYYPIIKKLAEQKSFNDGWVSREEIQNNIKETFNFSDEIFGRSENGGAIPLDHCWSHRFDDGDTKELFNQLFEHDAEKTGERKNKFRLKTEYSEAVIALLNEYQLSNEEVKYCINERITTISKRDLRIWKMSHGKSGVNISDSDNDWLMKHSYIAQGWRLDGLGKGKGQGKKFASMKNGDYFYLVRNSTIVLLGKIIDDKPSNVPSNLQSISSWYMRKFELVKDISGDNFTSNKISGSQLWKPQGQSTVTEIKKNELADFEKEILIPAFKMTLEELGIEIKNTSSQINFENDNTMSNKKQQTLNQILFGPPGTGKTYNTINKALEIIGENIEGISREEIKEIFDYKVQEGQIVFTTFHQSMSYEDFIEGIKPETVNGNVIYNVIDGIFKKLCLTAKTPNQIDFNSAYEQLKTDLTNKEMIELKTPTGKEFSISLNSNDNLTLHTGSNKEKKGSLTKENIQKQINGEDKFIGWEGYFKGVVNYLETQYGYSSEKSITQNFVLIIDEINRGNVSQIFGELITLIEDDKRLGKEEKLEVVLPYSKENFGVPSNLYIIGTMNTADRSVEALDAALRRRFSFEEMPPKPELITVEYIKDSNDVSKNISLSELLRKINKRIEKLLDKDHQIGHSYFLSIKSIDDLKIAFQNKIIPLLQEYFFGDYGKIGLVLGKEFFEPIETSNENIFADFDDYDASDFSERVIYKIKKIIDMSDNDFIKAINLLLNK